MSASIQVDLLGGVAVRGADPAQVRGSSRALSLLAYLAAHPDTAQPRAHLAGMLWPDSSQSQARTNLRRELHHLRTLLRNSPCLRSDDGSLCWHSGADVAVDVPDFLTACRDVDAALAADRPTAVAEHGDRALTLFRGPFLPGFDDDWVLEVREELRRACVDLCDRIAAFWLDHDDAAAAVGFARRRVLLEPLEEPGHRLLMRAQLGAGDRAGAMRTYHHCASCWSVSSGWAPRRRHGQRSTPRWSMPVERRAPPEPP